MASGTYFFDENGNSLGTAIEILPLPLVEGMLMTFHGHSGPYRVVNWNYHHGHDDEDSGLRVHLLKDSEGSVSGKTGVEEPHDQEAAVQRVKDLARERAIEKLTGQA